MESYFIIGKVYLGIVELDVKNLYVYKRHIGAIKMSCLDKAAKGWV